MPHADIDRIDALETYLNDHLAGSVAAIELIEHLLQHSDGAREAFLRELLAEVKEDQSVLKDVITRMGGSEDRLKKSISWLGEKIDRFKFTHSAEQPDPGDLEECEVLAVGIYEKELLWKTLAAVLQDDERFADIDFQQLRDRAERQRSEVERFRMQAAQHVLASSAR